MQQIKNMREKNYERNCWHILVNKGTNSNSYIYICYPDLGNDKSSVWNF